MNPTYDEQDRYRSSDRESWVHHGLYIDFAVKDAEEILLRAEIPTRRLGFEKLYAPQGYEFEFDNPELDEIVIARGYQVGSEVWHAARIVQMADYVKFTHFDYYNEESSDVRPRIFEVMKCCCVELGMRIAISGFGDIHAREIAFARKRLESLANGRVTSSKNRKARTAEKDRRIFAAARLMWEKHPEYNDSQCAAALIRQRIIDGKLHTIRRRIKGKKPNPPKEPKAAVDNVGTDY